MFTLQQDAIRMIAKEIAQEVKAEIFRLSEQAKEEKKANEVLISRKEAAKMYGVSIQTIDNRIKDKTLPRYDGVGWSRFLVKISDLKRLELKGLLTKK